jgi:cytochrome d ubiquinol oxidase subunit II
MAAAVGAILLASVTLYAVLGGADFGGGLWDLLAGGTVAGRAPRALIDESITPVWEGNHVWLVFDLVIFWTAFPRAFASVMTALALPLWLAVGGIVLRGVGFAFRKEITRLPLQRAAGALFAFSSVLTPFFMGTVVGAIAAGAVPADASRAILSAWTSPTALLSGFLFVAACGYLAAVYLISEAQRRGDLAMRAYFTRRAQAAAIVAGALSLADLLVLRGPDPVLFGRLTGRAVALVVAAGVCGLAVLAMVTARRAREARVIAALGVASVIWGWGVAQYPVVLPGTDLTLTSSGATQATFTALVVVAIAAVILVVPSFILLFSLQGRGLLGEPSTVAAALAGPAVPGGPAGPPGEPSGQVPGSPARPQAGRHLVPAAGAVLLGLAAAAALARRLWRRPPAGRR